MTRKSVDLSAKGSIKTYILDLFQEPGADVTVDRILCMSSVIELERSCFLLCNNLLRLIGDLVKVV